MFFKAITLIVMTACLGAASSAFAKRDKDHRGERGDAISAMERHLTPEKMRELNLSEDQIVKIKEMREANRSEMKSAKEEMKTAKKDLKKLIKSQASDADILKAYESFEAKKSKLSKKRMENLLKARAVLTAEQKNKLFEAKE